MHPSIIEMIIICLLIEIFEVIVKLIKWIAGGVEAVWMWIVGIFDYVWAGGAWILDTLQVMWEWVTSIIP